MSKLARYIGSNFIFFILVFITSIQSICEYYATPNPSNAEVALYGLSIVSLCMATLFLMVLALNKSKAKKK